MRKNIKVLLVSPRIFATSNRYCGDHAYTDMLLQYPPENVTYWHYTDLLTEGNARRLIGYSAAGYYLRRLNLLPPDMWGEYITVNVKPDIIHIYGFSSVVKFAHSIVSTPIILGSGTGGYSDLKYYWNWSEKQIKRMRWYKRLYLRVINAHDSSLRPERASRILTWSHFSRNMHLDEGYVHPKQIEVLSPGILSPRVTDGLQRQLPPITFLFIGRDFVRKNGQMVVKAFREVHKHYPESKLIVIGIPQNGKMIQEPGVIHLHFVPREELFQKIYPQADVLVLPSRAEGFGLVILEAMSMGLAVIAINAWAMPEIIANRKNGILLPPDSCEDLIKAMLHLAENHKIVYEMKQESLKRFKECFSIDVHNRRLREIYKEVLAGACE